MIGLKQRVRVDRRVLGAIRFVDATLETPVERPLIVRSDALSFTRNGSGLYVISGLKPAAAADPALAAHLAAFEAPPADPAVGALDFLVTVTDPQDSFVARSFTVSLPRAAPDPPRDGPPDPDELLVPVQIALMRGPAAGFGPNWSGARLSLSRADGTPLAGALARILRKSDDQLLGESLSDARGEAFVPVVGIPVVDFVTEPPDEDDEEPEEPDVTVKTVAVRLEILTLASDDGSGPADPDAIRAAPRAWRPVEGDLPEPELQTGTIVTRNLGLVLEPQP